MSLMSAPDAARRLGTAGGIGFFERCMRLFSAEDRRALR